jgi:hypothetical protein
MSVVLCGRADIAAHSPSADAGLREPFIRTPRRRLALLA